MRSGAACGVGLADRGLVGCASAARSGLFGSVASGLFPMVRLAPMLRLVY